MKKSKPWTACTGQVLYERQPLPVAPSDGGLKRGTGMSMTADTLRALLPGQRTNKE
ncbi:hypothetical protein [Pseudomonas kilonensis]|uniref:hypothetical protein n=1 Tax=Pseudomonas kilonensis TaxID=132476 RepID=UPI00041B76FA|nr:hypothetical protein [Pseudomonas kilonensis]